MGRTRPGFAHRTVLQIEPSRGKATIGASLMLAITAGLAAAALAYRTDAWPERWRPDTEIPDRFVLGAAGVMGLFALICLVAAVVNGRRWRIARAIERLASDPALAATLPADEFPPPTAPAEVVPPLTVDVLAPRKLPRPAAKCRQVTSDRNVLGGRPLEIAYLRLFENRPRTRTFVEGAWREFGHVYLLRSAASVTPAEYKAFRRSGDVAGLFVDSLGEMRDELDRTDRRPLGKGRHKFREVAPSTLRVRDRYGSYPMTALLCHGAFWKRAVDELLARVDLVALDLSGFSPANAGTRHELQRVVDRFPIERVVFLADQRSNRKFLVAQIEQTWARMASGSPNAVPQPKTAIVAITDQIRYSQSTGAGGESGPIQVSLVARRSETRKLVAMAQARIGG